ncbi:MAG: hypothetical protein WAV31_05730 [Candidatus Moraniibacteriota bacterium]
MDEQNNNSSEKNAQKIQALRDMISNAEITLQGAKSMLLQLEGKKKTGRRRKAEDEDDENNRVIEGTFDGQIMIGTDGKQYPVPANYASKSKLVKGDMLKLTITSDGSFVYKQIGPVVRKMTIGTVNQDVDGNYFVAAEGKAYRVLLASITYFKVEPGDEVTLVTPRDMESEWGAIENVLQKVTEKMLPEKSPEPKNIDDIFREKPSYTKPSYYTEPTPTEENKPTEESASSIIDEWAPDLEELRKELAESDDKAETKEEE